MTALTFAEQWRTAIYRRQSKGKEVSLEDQLAIGTRRADREPWTVVASLADGVSASRHAKKVRDDWPRLVRMVEANLLDMIWLWDASRGDRTASTWLGFLEQCQAHNVVLYIEADQRTYDPNNPRDWKVLASAGVDAQSDADRIKENTMRGKNQARRRGDFKAVLGGRVRFGWYDPGPRQPWQVDEAAAKVLTEVAERLLKGERIGKVHATIVKRRRKPLLDSYGEEVSADRLWNTLAMPLTGGMMRGEDGELIATGTGPLDAELWGRVQSMIAGRRRGRQAKEDYPLGKLLVCGRCGNQLTGGKTQARKEGQVQKPAYRCRTPHPATGHHTTCGLQISADVVHDAIREALDIWVEYSPRAKRMGRQRVDLSPKRKALDEEWQVLQDRMSGLETKRDRNRISPAQFREHEAVIEADFARVEAERKALAVADRKPLPVTTDWTKMTAVEKQAVVEEWFVTPIRIPPQAETGTRDQAARMVGALRYRD